MVSGSRVATGARSDFIPAHGARFYSANQLVGDQPVASFAGSPSRAHTTRRSSRNSRIPAEYVVCMASGGSLVASNPIMLRQHERFTGLQLIPGDNGAYPLRDSYWVRGFGTGTRHRLAGLVMQVKASGSYAVPALYA